MHWLLPFACIIARHYLHLFVPSKTIMWSPVPIVPAIILYLYGYLRNKLEGPFGCSASHKKNDAVKSVGASTSFMSQDKFGISLAKA